MPPIATIPAARPSRPSTKIDRVDRGDDQECCDRHGQTRRGGNQRITAFLIVASINAVNFVDGLDGLAAGIVAIGGIAFAAW